MELMASMTAKRSLIISVEQLQNTGPLLKVYIREWLAGSEVAVVLEERGRYIREWLGGSTVALMLEERCKFIREWLRGSSARQWL